MNQNRLNYIYKNFALIYDFNGFDKIAIAHSSDLACTSKIVISKSNTNISEKPTLCQWNEKSIPFLFDSDKKEVITQNENQVIINYDIISAIFYLLSGQQEIESITKDNYGRFQYKDSLQHEFNFAETPVVNYYFDILKTAIELAYSIEIKLKHNFTTCLTHDIDEVDSAWKHRIRLNLQKKKFIKAGLSFISHLFQPFYPWRNIEEILTLENEKGVTSSFFILTNNIKVEEIKNADYKLDSNYMKQQLQNISKNGNEIAVHGSYKTHDEASSLACDIKLLKEKVNGNRFHFLQWDMEQTPYVIDSNHLSYDTSLGFQEQIGFRNGICNPFYLYDFKNEKAFSFLEIPLNIMDCSLAYTNYMGIEPKKVKNIIKPIISEIKKFNGVLTLNWHNTFFTDYTNSEWKTVYLDIIENCKAKNSNFVTCSQITKNYLK